MGRSALAVGLLELAQRAHAEQLAGARALRAALVVARGGQAARLAGVERHDPPSVVEHERDRRHPEAREVDLQRRVGLPAQRGELVEQAGARADPLVLDARAQTRQLDAIELGVRER